MTYDCSFLGELDLDGDVSFGDSHRDGRAGDWGTPDEEKVRPDAVVWPGSTEDVSKLLAAATERGVPVTPYAAGTGLEGNATPVEAGISLDMTRMDEVLDVRPEDFQIDVEPGVIGSAVDEAVASHGLFFPPLPSSGEFSTVGGMVATDASGMKTVKYGEVADWVLELEAVLADGTVIKLGSKAAKTSSGYNLKDLVVGSEGTLAVVTRVTLRLAGIPAQKRAGRAVFASLDDATAAVADAVTSGVDVATIELLDETSTRMANAYSDTDLPDAPTVFFEFHADHGVDEEVAFCRSLFESNGAERFEVSADDTEMAELWQARKDLAYAVQSWDPDLRPLHPGDVTVPISAYGEVVSYAKELAADRGLIIPCFGHAGDGNVHYSVLVDPDDPESVELGERTYSDIVHRALELGGTATGEHGIGLGKREYLVAEHGEAAVRTMRAVKDTLDPTGTLNPGKIFPDE
ncbi:lactate dehydrogenase [Haloprofundus marisrubri]|uniref:D-lactate dehydrogenase (cytochrome) n=1 Tax=Haloprofundus marisrubri TaxID=1514971 RepID=A0A0W1R6X4_9EURY|nr:FAD-binding oxidoreductase [Haloprofundus marisrubri]KTG09129.1 lactate dehydrogenase [Haloprofundus marisrubri]